MSIYDEVLERDSEGKIRFPTALRLDEKATKKLADFLYMNTIGNKNVGVKQLNETFAEAYRFRKKVPGRQPGSESRHWDWEQVKIILLNHEKGLQRVGELLERSAFSIKHEQAHALSLFYAWVDSHEADTKDLSREENGLCVKILIRPKGY